MRLDNVSMSENTVFTISTDIPKLTNKIIDIGAKIIDL